MAVEFEDDVFFADISKQIALLIMDDEDSFPAPRPSIPVQEFPYFPQTIVPPTYNNYEASYKSKGTGVFIPKSTVVPRRKNKSNRTNATNNYNNKKQNDKSSAKVSSVTTNENNRIFSSYYSNSSVLKRHL